MKISYNWLKDFVKTDLSPEEAGKLLTGCGLEVESIEAFETLKGGLKGLVIGEVITKEKHPDADKLSVTTVDIGTGTLLNIVCGAPNVAAGQKVVVATVGAKLYPVTGEPFEIKKSKIRGAVSEGMLCAEDEIGLGSSHAGIIVLDEDAKVGMPAGDYFKIDNDYTFEIGLTPNRADAASHVGVARDLVAVLNTLHPEQPNRLLLPDVGNFAIDYPNDPITVFVEEPELCVRYSGLSMQGIVVKDSPDWLKNRLKAIGIRPINNIVDATNYVLHELGQPLHAFDADKIKGKKVIVKRVPGKTNFVSLDGVQRELSPEDLMICDEAGGMCIAGVFGGLESGVTESTTNLFLESACFNSTTVRKSSKRHNLKTDASFRFERGTDPNMTVFALERVALLIKQIAGGEIASNLIDVYPKKVEPAKVPFSFKKCDQLVGKHLPIETIKHILSDLSIEIEHEGHDALLLSVPPFKVDVTREQDVIEEVLRIYGYNNIEIPLALNSSLAFAEKPDKEKIQSLVSELLSNNGFYETMSLSLTKEEYSSKLPFLDPEKRVRMLNPLSTDLAVLRQSMIFNGLENIAYNVNRKNSDLKLYEFGKTYQRIQKEKEVVYIEDRHLAVFITGKKLDENWTTGSDAVNFYTLKGIVNSILNRLGIDVKPVACSGDVFAAGMAFAYNKRVLVEMGLVNKALLKATDVKQEVYAADFNWDLVLEALKQKKTALYREVAKFPEVRRDLALLVDESMKFETLEQLAYQSEKKMLRDVKLFDVYQGDKLPAGKKSYAMSFTLLDEQATLTDKQIEQIMDKLMKTFKEKAGAEIRS